MEKLNRRRFLGSAVAGAITAPAVLAASRDGAQDKNIRLGLIGCGWYGMVDVQAAFKSATSRFWGSAMSIPIT